MAGMSHDGGDWDELEDMSDAKIEAFARFAAVMGETEDRAAFRDRMLGSEAAWEFEGPEMKVGFTEAVNGGSVTTYQSATFYKGVWY
jgi:hypothetical protein